MWISIPSGATVFFFFNDTATTEIYTLSLHDALPICRPRYACRAREEAVVQAPAPERPITGGMATEALLAHVLVAKDRKSTRLNSSHANISYAVFCLKKKNNNIQSTNIYHLYLPHQLH